MGNDTKNHLSTQLLKTVGNTTLQQNFELPYPPHLNDFHECILRIVQQQYTGHFDGKVTLTHLLRFIDLHMHLLDLIQLFMYTSVPLFSVFLDNCFHKLEQDEARHCQIFLLPDVTELL